MPMEKTWIGCASANFRGGRANGAKPEAIVIHIIVGSLKSAGITFGDPHITPNRSAHYGVGRGGIVHQYVREQDTAFHAGIVDAPTAKLVKERPGRNPNSYTIGIEHEGMPGDPWPQVQFETSAALVAEVATRWDIPFDRHHVLMHREIRASKSCPGSWIDENKLAELIGRAAAVALSAPRPVLPPPDPGFPQRVRIIRPVHVRAGQPSTGAPSVCVLRTGAEVDVASLVRGTEPIQGNPHWCVLADRTGYCWSGATDVFTRVPFPRGGHDA